MSEPEFRAWAIKKNEFIDDVIHDGESWLECEGYEASSLSEIFDGDEFIVEQYTGVKDKNGTKIYEGDIVLDYYDGEDTFIVEWDKDAVSFILTDTDNIVCVDFDDYFPDKELEVIGNVHENPELMDEEE